MERGLWDHALGLHCYFFPPWYSAYTPIWQAKIGIRTQCPLIKRRDSYESHYKSTKASVLIVIKIFCSIYSCSFSIHSCPQSTEMIDCNMITLEGDQSLWASSCMLARSQPVSPLNVVGNLLNLLCESRRENCLANSDKHLFKSIFVLVRSPGQLLLGCHGNRHTHHLHINFCNEHKITKPSW